MVASPIRQNVTDTLGEPYVSYLISTMNRFYGLYFNFNKKQPTLVIVASETV